ncbi:hypothetical protein E0W45_10835 [Neisseria meningitidis]|uniref:Uncharacterized protein n=1 Tax=Neisseria meningitidis serogroup B (strain ATCC BAA-335 / MC58) TaxID=122586 RepID=Q9K1C9_NEIMB|nr:hypothetical protein NMB0233 [Neisseria meningitidis MC58]AVI44659.1 hypothetical protein A6J49_14000 [Neisseria meningitidis]MBG8613283.1 hypothetical protein [Neisseria meningitidis]MBG8625673.1 hypothetical protein [Neisseria meningitidis]MBG8635044.1 hypothetical protein [Neisseria meningitidis]
MGFFYESSPKFQTAFLAVIIVDEAHATMYTQSK